MGKPGAALIEKYHEILVRKRLQRKDAAVISTRSAMDGDDDRVGRVTKGFCVISYSINSDVGKRGILNDGFWDRIISQSKHIEENKQYDQDPNKPQKNFS